MSSPRNCQRAYNGRSLNEIQRGVALTFIARENERSSVSATLQKKTFNGHEQMRKSVAFLS